MRLLEVSLQNNEIGIDLRVFHQFPVCSLLLHSNLSVTHRISVTLNTYLNQIIISDAKMEKKINFFILTQKTLWAKASSLSRIRDYTQLDTLISVGLLWTNDQPDERPLLDNTQHSQETLFYAPGGIRTHKPSKRAVTEPCLRQRGHWDRHFLITVCYYVLIRHVFNFLYAPM
jgi:hypothetical protein